MGDQITSTQIAPETLWEKTSHWAGAAIILLFFGSLHFVGKRDPKEDAKNKAIAVAQNAANLKSMEADTAKVIRLLPQIEAGATGYEQRYLYPNEAEYPSDQAFYEFCSKAEEERLVTGECNFDSGMIVGADARIKAVRSAVKAAEDEVAFKDAQPAEYEPVSSWRAGVMVYSPKSREAEAGAAMMHNYADDLRSILKRGNTLLPAPQNCRCDNG